MQTYLRYWPRVTLMIAFTSNSTGDFNMQELANTAWAFAPAGSPNAELFAVLAKEAERYVEDFATQEPANIAWTFSTAGFSNAYLFARLAKGGLVLRTCFEFITVFGTSTRRSSTTQRGRLRQRAL